MNLLILDFIVAACLSIVYLFTPPKFVVGEIVIATTDKGLENERRACWPEYKYYVL